MYFYDQTFATLESFGVLKLSISDSFRALFIPHPWWTCTLELGSCGSSYINWKVVEGREGGRPLNEHVGPYNRNRNDLPCGLVARDREHKYKSNFSIFWNRHPVDYQKNSCPAPCCPLNGDEHVLRLLFLPVPEPGNLLLLCPVPGTCPSHISWSCPSQISWNIGHPLVSASA